MVVGTDFLTFLKVNKWNWKERRSSQKGKKKKGKVGENRKSGRERGSGRGR
jgi:hypothetical protein